MVTMMKLLTNSCCQSLWVFLVYLSSSAGCSECHEAIGRLNRYLKTKSNLRKVLPWRREHIAPMLEFLARSTTADDNFSDGIVRADLIVIEDSDDYSYFLNLLEGNFKAEWLVVIGIESILFDFGEFQFAACSNKSTRHYRMIVNSCLLFSSFSAASRFA